MPAKHVSLKGKRIAIFGSVLDLVIYFHYTEALRGLGCLVEPITTDAFITKRLGEIDLLIILGSGKDRMEQVLAHKGVLPKILYLFRDTDPVRTPEVQALKGFVSKGIFLMNDEALCSVVLRMFS